LQGFFGMSAEEVEERKSPTGDLIYEVVFDEGEEELKRRTPALAWDGLAAGMSMGFSFLGAALLRAFLPDAPWTPLVSSFGYTLGFLIVILGRQQLFTENTLTVVLPLLRRRDAHTLGNVVRLWGTVLAANVVGAVAFAAVLALTDVVQPHVFSALRETAREAASPSFAITLVRGIFAGWLIAMVVWLLPFAESGRIAVIVTLTYIVGLAHLAHVIVGTVDGSFAVMVGDQSLSDFVLRGFVPSLLGNIIGGVSLVAALTHAQVVSGEETRGNPV
jgi:formate/nitrite transporter FocA (FNT family)